MAVALQGNYIGHQMNKLYKKYLKRVYDVS